MLDGDDAVQARAAIDDIAAALTASAASVTHPSLSDGNAGRALLYAYLGEVWPDRGFDDLVTRHLERAIDQMTDQSMHAGLYGGFTGLAWVTEHLQPGLAGDDDANLAVDELLRDFLSATPWSGEYDVISGLAGCGVYGLERLPRAIAAEIVARVVARLDELAITDAGGICWQRRPELLVPETRARSPGGFYDLGVAHGNPGVLAVLAGARAHGVAAEVADRLLAGAWHWMMAHRLPAAEATYAYSLPSLDTDLGAGARDRPGPARNAWCYGDPGVAAAMYAAATAVGNPAWGSDALAIARRAAARPPERCGCVDAGLCHGTAGLALIYHRLWNATHEAVFADAARLWYRRTLELRRPGTGIAGFQTYYPGSSGESPHWIDDASFLTGTEGIALTLLAGISTVAPAWDRVLLVSLRSAR